MPTERLHFPRGVAFRGALWITLIALLTTSMALTVQYLQTARLLETQMRGLLDDEASGLVERYRAGGVLELAAFLKRQQELPRLNEFFYLLSAPDGTSLAGNLVSWPQEVDRTGFHEFATSVAGPDGEPKVRRIATHALLLDDSYRLLVGRFAEERAALRDGYQSALFWSLLVTGLLGLLFGWWYSRRGLAFVEELSATGARFLGGRLQERVPVSGSGDEYDRLAATINACFVEIEHVVRSLRAATDGMAHDLKTPLTRVYSRLELAEMRELGPDDLRKAIEESRTDLAGLLRIIDDILSVARAEATTSASFSELDLAEIVTDAAELYEPVAETRRVHLDLRLEAAPLQGSRALLSQLVANLIDNAVKYSPEDAAVKITLSRLPGNILLRVEDRGPGIPAEHRDLVMSRFVKLDESRGRPGVGLGLSIVSAVARVHRASVRLEDAEPGLCVEVDFPERPSATPKAAG